MRCFRRCSRHGVRGGRRGLLRGWRDTGRNDGLPLGPFRGGGHRRGRGHWRRGLGDGGWWGRCGGLWLTLSRDSR